MKNKLFSYVSAKKTWQKTSLSELNSRSYFSIQPQWAMYVTLVKLDKNDENLLHTSMIGVCLGTQLGTIVEPCKICSAHLWYTEPDP